MRRTTTTHRPIVRSLAGLALLLLAMGVFAGNTGGDCLPGPVGPVEDDPPGADCRDGGALGIEAGMSFSQAQVFDGWQWTAESPIGAATLAYVGVDELLYLTLVLDGRTVLRDVPVRSVEGAGVFQEVTYTFDLGVAPGQDVPWVMAAWSLSTCPAAPLPEEPWDHAVGDHEVILYPGAPGFPTVVSSGPGEEPEGGPAAEPVRHVNSGFPNQESDRFACAPTAVSNSLQFLNAKHDLGIAAGAITIERMKQATNFGDKGAAGTGCWIDPDPRRPAGERKSWWQSKDQYMKDHDLPIVTRMSETATDALNALDEDCDVEMELHGHTVAVVGMTRLADGRLSVDIKHDVRQGVAGGTVTETVTLDPTTGRITGGTGTGGGFNYLVIECPEEEEAGSTPSAAQ